MLGHIFEMRLQNEIDGGQSGQEKSCRTGPGRSGRAVRERPRRYQSNVSQQAQKIGALKMKGKR